MCLPISMPSGRFARRVTNRLMSHPANEERDQNRAQWLEEQSMKEEDVLEDKGGEFIYIEWKKVYLPDRLQKGFDGADFNL